MILGRLEYGLGNQMFQYAFFKVLQKHYDADAIIDISCGSAFGEYHARKPIFLLSDLNIQKDGIHFETDEGKFKKKAGWRWTTICACEFIFLVIGKIFDSKDLFHVLQKKAQRVLNRIGIYNMQYGPANLSFDSKSPKIIFKGPFLSGSYFDEIADEIKREFQVITPIDDVNAYFLKKINETESVCVHVRRGDFTTDRYKMLNVCGPEYYQKAIEYIISKVPDARFFVFSNDLAWARQNLDFKGNAIFVDANSSQKPANELRLMMSCKHFIIANSSFSWWAQYLCSNPNKVIVAPKYFRTPSAHNKIVSTSYQMENWTQIDNCEDEL